MQIPARKHPKALQLKFHKNMNKTWNMHKSEKKKTKKEGVVEPIHPVHEERHSTMKNNKTLSKSPSAKRIGPVPKKHPKTKALSETKKKG